MPPKKLFLVPKKESMLHLLSMVEQSSNVRYFHSCFGATQSGNFNSPKSKWSSYVHTPHLMYQELKVKLVEWKCATQKVRKKTPLHLLSMVGQSSMGEWKRGPNTNYYKTSRQKWPLGALAIQPTPIIYLTRPCVACVIILSSSIENQVGERKRKKKRRGKFTLYTQRL